MGNLLQGLDIVTFHVLTTEDAYLASDLANGTDATLRKRAEIAVSDHRKQIRLPGLDDVETEQGIACFGFRLFESPRRAARRIAKGMGRHTAHYLVLALRDPARAMRLAAELKKILDQAHGADAPVILTIDVSTVTCFHA